MHDPKKPAEPVEPTTPLTPEPPAPAHPSQNRPLAEDGTRLLRPSERS